ncbi:MAG: hypothetical protein LBG92_06655 [Prevotellaceae bacterium]|nr:hypothetical protein [Prevotellaceae bacterium]
MLRLYAVAQSFSSLPVSQNFNSIAIEFCLSVSLLLSFLAAGNATLACGYENFVPAGHFNS